MLWITGANGLLGKVLKCKAAIQNPKDAASSGAPDKCKAALHSGREVDIGDINAVRDFARKNPVTYIINCAAYSLVDQAEAEKEASWRANAIGPENLAIVAKEIGAKLVHISTDYVFPGDGGKPLTELDPVGPCNFYGEGKLEGERRALAFGACVVRTSWIFGDGGKNFVAKLFSMLQTEKEIKLTEDQWGRATYAPDLADALLQMLDRTGLYQYANRGVINRYEFGVAMKEEMLALGYKVTASIVPVKGASFPQICKRPVYSAFDTTKIEQLMPIRPWREALREFLCARLPVSL